MAYRCDFYMKSGNSFSIVVKNLIVPDAIDNDANSRKILSWEKIKDKPQIFDIDFRQVEAIVTTEIPDISPKLMEKIKELKPIDWMIDPTGPTEED